MFSDIVNAIFAIANVTVNALTINRTNTLQLEKISCKIIHAIFWSSYCVSIFSFTVIAVERYLIIRGADHDFEGSRSSRGVNVSNNDTLIIQLCLVWFLSMLIGGLCVPLVSYNPFSLYARCDYIAIEGYYTTIYFTTLAIVFCLLPISIILYCYVYIFVKISTPSRNWLALNTLRLNRYSRRYHLIRLPFATTVIFVVLVIPLIIIIPIATIAGQSLRQFANSHAAKELALATAHLMFYSAPAVNPVVILIINKRIRRKVKEGFSILKCKSARHIRRVEPV
ncbi:Sphingosine 1-phosphate receptor 1 [Trichoplax sp. H2]|nr:Sphingosine 1-phosphate receptor 1 [Trichoplax sp. H2]|eukprot:RDD46748.1 Sphingosine 1-phosphate receptor 1 [Trichoplax sp. H2]